MAKPTTDEQPEQTVHVEVVRPTALTRDSSTLARTVGIMTRITNSQMAHDAGQFLRLVRERQRQIALHYREVRRPLREALQRITEMEHRDVAPWEAADAAVTGPLEAWLKADKARVEAENRARLQAAEDAARIEREAQADALRRAAAAAPSKSTQKRLETMAKQVEASPVLPVVSGTVEPQKIEGISMPTRKVGTVTDLMVLVQAVAAGRVPLNAIQPNQKVIDSQAAALGEHLNWPGVTVTEDSSITARGSK